MTFPATVLPILVEMLIDGTWTDITTYVQRRDNGGIETTRGRADEAGTLEPSAMSLSLNNRDGRFSPRNPSGTYYGLIGRNTPIRCSITGATYLLTNQDTGVTVGTASVSTPDTAALDITGDIDIRFEADFDSWRSLTELVSKYTQSGSQRSYALIILTDGYLQVRTSVDGAAFIISTCTVPVPVTHGQLTVRATVDVDNGAAGNTVTFYTGTEGVAGSFTQLGDPVVNAGTTSIFSSSSVVYLLDNPGSSLSTQSIRGKVYAAQIRSSIGGTVVANPDFTIQTEGATSFADSTSKTWTLNGTPTIDDRDYRFYGEVSSFPQQWDITGTDVWVPLQAYGVLRRLNQGSPALHSAIYTGAINQPDLVAYWPCEDAVGSTLVASASPGGSSMRPNGTLDLASDSSYPGSGPILKFGTSNLSGKVKSYTSTGFIQLQFLLAVPLAGATNNAVIARIVCGGTAPRWDLEYGTGGTLELISYDADGVVLQASGAAAFGINGELERISVELTTNGADVDWAITTLAVGETIGATTSGTLTSETITRITSVTMNAIGGMSDVACGHITAYKSFQNIFNLDDEMIGYAGETAGDRIARLFSESNLDFEFKGDLDDSAAMGPQGVGILLDLVQECVEADLGQMYESRESLRLGYIPQAALYGQTADLTLDYSENQLAELQPVEDDKLLRNDVTVTRTGGSTYRSVLETGTMSTLAPADGGVGVYDTSVTLNLEDDDQLPDQATWRVRLGTIDEARYPKVKVNLAHPEFFDNDLLRQARAMDAGMRLVITDPPAWIPPDDISAVVQGYTEFLSNFEHTIEWNCSPSVPLDTAGFYDVPVSRYSPDENGTALDEDLDTTETGVTVEITSGPLWITTALIPDDFPFDIMIGGERMTVTACTGTSSPQTFTVTRSVNGVVKTHLTGADVVLFQPAYYVV